MKIEFYQGSPFDAGQTTDGLVLFMIQDGENAWSAPLNEITHGAFNAWIKRKSVTGKAKERGVFHLSGGPAGVVVVQGVGEAKSVTSISMRKAAGGAVKALIGEGAKTVALLVPVQNGLEDSAGTAQACAEACGMAAYIYDEHTTKHKEDYQTLDAATICSADADHEKAVWMGEIIAAGVNFARNLGNGPGNFVTPTYLSERAEELGQASGLKVTIFDEDKMEELGMGSILGVARGSDEPAKMIFMEYSCGNDAAPTIAFVGKGLTFDAGGISLKPGPGMDEMKFDMCGSAAVFGAMKAISELKPTNVNVIGVVPSSENLPSGNAYKPGDILKSYSGQTIEVLNTDAEGRLILADALTYTARNYKPAAIVDLATLTGAILIALGKKAIGLMTTSPELGDKIKTASGTSGEKVWELPLWSDYDEQIKSKIADWKNTGGRDAGSITAGLFLSKFVDECSWAHLDIAGTAWGDKPHELGPHGATGVGVRLLVELARSWS